MMIGGMNEDELDTPAVVVDVARLERNVARMASVAQRAGVRLRPHAKTHKSAAVARLQIAGGASGLTVAKLGEAEAFAEAGFDDFFLAYPVVGREKARRLLALAERARMIVGVESEEGARSLSEVFAAAGRRLDVRIEIDVGLERTGVLPEAAPTLAAVLARLPGVRLQGLFTHAGQAYAETSIDGVGRVGRHEGEILARCAETLRRAGFEVEDVSVGSTPTAADAMSVAGVTECRPGTYVFNDATQVALGVCGPEDCALTVLATVVSVPSAGRVVVDAGTKTLTSEALRSRPDTFGLLTDGRGRVVRLNEEHGVVEPASGASFRVGERVRILPSHVCPVVNLHDRLTSVRNGRVEGELDVCARGRVR
jgi:D-serine deaminase-like pyridoxal phosphate-dependent protein